MSARAYAFFFSNGDVVHRWFRSTQDAIDCAKKESDGVERIVICREEYEYPEVGCVENGVFTADAQESDPLRDAAPDLLAVLCEVRDIGVMSCCCERPNGKCCGTCTATKIEAAIAKAKGGAK